jgi:general secretion pathway protein B
MSLLLDALKKSEAQRRRGQPPSITPGPGGSRTFGSPTPRRPRWLWIAAIAALVVVVAGAWPWLPAVFESNGGTAVPAPSDPDRASRTGPPQTQQAQTRQAQTRQDQTRQTQTQQAQTQQAQTQQAQTQQAQTQQTQTQQTQTQQTQTQQTQRAGIAQAPARPPQNRRAEPRAASAPAAAGESKANIDASGDEPGDASDAIRPWELPEAQRAAFPELDVTVHFFAAEPDDRFVLVNGERYREGDAIEAGVRVERILRRGVVVEFRNYRILIE